MTLLKVIVSNLILAFCLRYLQPHVLQETNVTKSNCSYLIEFSKADLSLSPPFVLNFHAAGAIRLSSCDTLTPVVNTFRFALINHTLYIYDRKSITGIVQQVAKVHTLLDEAKHAITLVHKAPNVSHSINHNHKPFKMASVPWTGFPVLFVRLVWHYTQPSEFMLLAVSLPIYLGILYFHSVYPIQDNQIYLPNKPIRPEQHNENRPIFLAQKNRDKMAHKPISPAQHYKNQPMSPTQHSEDSIDSSVRRVWVDMWRKLGDSPPYQLPHSIFGASFNPLNMSEKRLSKMPKQKFNKIKWFLDCLPEPLTPMDYTTAQAKRNEALLKEI